MSCAPACPEHGVALRLKESRYGKFYSCPEWPACDVKVGCHPGTDRPLGTPATKEVAAARIRAHDAFDTLWQGPGAPMARGEAYRWLAEQLGVDRDDCHIGNFDEAMCDRVVDLVVELGEES